MRFRDFLKLRQESGELITISDEIDWNLEAAAISAMNYRLWQTRRSLLFTTIKGYPGMRLASSLFLAPLHRPFEFTARVFGLRADCSVDSYFEEAKRRLSYRVPPTVVSWGPCKENILLGKEANLFAFPFPYLHEGDGGRYGTIQTWIGKDPDSNWVNYGNYRLEIHTRNKLGTFLTPGQHHADIFYQKYEARGQTMPVCICVGPDLEVLMVSAIPVPRGVSEVEVAGALAGEPIELVKAETNDLLVPAHSEIVLEGEMRPYERMDEGPFGEVHGYLHGPRVPQPVIRINCITYRTNPLIPFVAEGLPGCDTEGLVVNFGPAGTMQFKEMGFPVKKSWMMTGRSGGRPVTVEVTHPGVAEDLCNLAMFGSRAHSSDRMEVFDDVEAYDDDAMIEAIFVKTHPTNFRINKMDLTRTQEGMMYLTPEEKPRAMGPRMLVDCTWPATWGPERIPQKVTFENSYPQSVRDWVARNWKALGVEEEIKGG